MQEQLSVLAIIPARAGSKGIPRKNARDLTGKPLIHYSCECARESRHITRSIVSTDCAEIAELARSAGVEAPFLRPAELATDTSPTLDVIEHAISWLDRNERWKPGIVVLLQPTSPFRSSTDVDNAIDQLIGSGADSIVSVCRIESHFHPEWQFTIREGELHRYVGGRVDSVPTRRQSLSPTYSRNGAIYAFRRESLNATGSIYGNRCLAFEMPADRSINIDSLTDWKAAENQLADDCRIDLQLSGTN